MGKAEGANGMVALQWLAPCCLFLAARVAAQQVEPIPAPPPFPIVEAPQDGTVVRVVDAAGKAVPGAFVTIFEKRLDDAVNLAPEPRLAELRRSVGKTVVTDAKGETRVGPCGVVVASAGSAYAAAWRWSRRAPFVLALRPSRSVTVTAVDREEKPLSDVPIVLRAQEEQSSPSNEWRARTDASGAVTFGPIDLYADLESDALSEMFVAVEAPMREPLRRRFTLKDLPQVPLQFALPPTGRLVIDVFDSEGNPATGTGSTTVRKPYEFEKDYNAKLAAGESWPGSEWFAYDELPHHELSCVETGLRFVVDADRDTVDDAKQLVVGPRSLGETVSVRLVGAPLVRLSARILDERGDPITDRTVEMFLAHDEHQRGRQSLGSARPDSHGRVSLALNPREELSFADEVPRWITIAVRDSDATRVVATAVVPLGAMKQLVARDLGDVRVHVARLLVSGVVVDDAGVGVSGAEVAVRIGMTKDEEEGFFGSFMSAGDSLLGARTGADGKFEIDGDDPGAQLDLDTSAGDVERVIALEERQSQPVAAGATDVRVVLARCGTIRGAVRGNPEEVDEVGYAVRGIRLDGSNFGWNSGLNADGEFEWSVPAGIASFEFTHGGSVFARRDHLEVKPGSVVEIPPIELAGAAHQVELTIVDELGKPIPDGWIAMPAEGEDEHLEEMKKMFPPDFPGFSMMPLRRDLVEFKDGKATLRSEHEPRPFAVGALGRAAVVVMHPATAERIVLEPAPVVLLALDFDGDPLPAGLEFFVTLSVPSDAKDWFRFGPDEMSRGSSKYPKLGWIELARGKPTELPIRAVGPTALVLSLGRKTKFGFNGTSIAGDPAVIDVERGKGNVFHVRVQRAAVDKIVAEDAKRAEASKDEKKDSGDGSDDDDERR
jgi:hypothetical protein